MSLSAQAQAVVDRVTAQRSGTGDVPHDPTTDRQILLAEIVKKLDSGAVGGGTSAKLVTVADDAAFAALTSEDINIGDFLKFDASASRPDAVFVNWIYFGPDPTNIYNYAYCVSSVDNEWAIGFLGRSNVGEARVALGAMPVLREFANDAAMFADTGVVSGDFIRLAASATWGAGATVQLIDSANTSGSAGYSLVLDGTTAAARSRLGLGSVATENTVPVAKGGTGATTAAAGAAALVNGNPIAPSSVATNLLSPSGVFEQRNGTTAQSNAIYGTWTSTTNYERVKICYNGATSTFQIGTEKGSGGGSARALDFTTDGTVHLTLGTTGILKSQLAGGGASTIRTSSNWGIGPSHLGTGMIIGDAVNVGMWFRSSGFISVPDSAVFGWAEGGGWSGSLTTAFSKISLGVVGIGNGTAGDFSGFAQDKFRRKGNGSPEGVVTAPIGCTYHREDGSAGTSFYVKESGAGNTGWVAK